jgi:hypothetical protein
MTTTLAQQVAFTAAAKASQSTRQDHIAAAKLLTPYPTIAVAVRSADRAHHARVAAAAAANGMTAEPERLAVLADPAPQETFSETDTTSFTLVGGRYFVVVAGTFGEGGGTITLQDANSNIFATFTANGNATVDLRYGVYNFSVSNVTGLTASIKTGTY